MAGSMTPDQAAQAQAYTNAMAQAWSNAPSPAIDPASDSASGYGPLGPPVASDANVDTGTPTRQFLRYENLPGNKGVNIYYLDTDGSTKMTTVDGSQYSGSGVSVVGTDNGVAFQFAQADGPERSTVPYQYYIDQADSLSPITPVATVSLDNPADVQLTTQDLPSIAINGGGDVQPVTGPTIQPSPEPQPEPTPGGTSVAPTAQPESGLDQVVHGVENFFGGIGSLISGAWNFVFHHGGSTVTPAPASTNMNSKYRQLAQILNMGEGNYESYNTGTYKVPGGRVGHSYLNPAPGTVTGKTINQILSTSTLPGTNPNRMFAVGAYQITTPTLRGAVSKLGLTGDERLTPEMQDRIFADDLVPTAGNGALGNFMTNGKGSVDDAQYAAAHQWASVAVPRGYLTQDGSVSDGNMTYYGGPANRANMRETLALRAFLSGSAR